MKKRCFLFGASLLAAFYCYGQEVSNPAKSYRNFPIIISLQFQNLASPFHDLKGNFNNAGILLGTEVSFNGKQNFVQQVQAGFYFNKNAGNGLMAYTQTVYRPSVCKYFYPEVKAGIGWQQSFHPVETYRFENGAWKEVTNGKSQLIIPVGISIGYNRFNTKTYLSPFITYQVMLATNYNRVIPLNFYSLFQLGTRIHFNYHSNQ